MKISKNLYSRLSLFTCTIFASGYMLVHAFTTLTISDADPGKTVTSTLVQSIMTNVNEIGGKFGTLTTGQWCTSDGTKISCTSSAPKVAVQTNTTTYSTSTTWALGPSFSTVTDFKAGSRVKLSYHIPMRNDSTGWGGGYIEPQVSFNGGSTWSSLGSSGYDGGVMNNAAPSIGSYFNTILIDPAQVSNFSVTVRFYFKSYDGTVIINGSHDINSISGVAPLMSGANGTQHYAKMMLEEIY